MAKGELPGPCDAYYVKPYVYEDCGYRPTAAELLSAIRCYGYQSCEHPGWAGSIAKRVCDLVQEEICAVLPIARRYFADP